MDIGPEKEIVRVEPVRDPFERDTPAPPAPEPREQPAEPAKPEPVPAGERRGGTTS